MNYGYKGQGITVASHEDIIEGVFDDVFCLNYGRKGNKYDEHGTLVMDYIRQVAPEAIKWSINSGARITNNKLQSEAIDYLLKNTPDFLGTANFSGFIDRDISIPYYTQMHEKGCYLVCAAGNKQEELYKLTQGDLWKAIGACRYNNGNPQIEEEYADGEEMDFVSLHNLKATYDNKKHKGTSYAYPIFMGMLALAQGFFVEKIGKKLRHDQLYKFIKDNCIDLEEKGYDNKTGYGLFILPDPETIEIKKYMEDYVEKKIVLEIGKNTVEVNGVEKTLDAPATIINNRTMVPLRFIAEELGCKVEWDEENRNVTIEK